MGKVVVRECEDCGDEIPKNERRTTCKRCGKKICGWCYNHLHGPYFFKAILKRTREIREHLYGDAQ